MQASCPNCGADTEVDLGELSACGGCGHWWIAEEQERATDPGVDIAAEAVEADDGVDIVPLRDAEESVSRAFARLRWAPPAAARELPALAHPRTVVATPPWEFELQLGVGDRPEGPYDRMYLRQAIYIGRLTGDENIRVPGTRKWKRLGDDDEFREVLVLVNGAEEPSAGRKKIARWRAAAPAAEASSASRSDDAGPATSAPAEPPRPVTSPRSDEAETGGRAKRLLGAGLVALLLGGLGWLLLG